MFGLCQLLSRAVRAYERSSTVNDQHMASDVTGLVGKQEAHGAADVPAGTFALEHGSTAPHVTRLFAHAGRVDHRRIHWARGDAVSADAVCAVIDRKRSGQGDNRTF